ncbi:MAG TPA: DMT family transporter [Burkholderiaceae bacterium]
MISSTSAPLRDRYTAALLAACAAGALWGTGALVVNLLIRRHGFSPTTISFWRFVIGAVVLLAVFGRPALWRAVRPQLGLVLASGVCMALYVLCWFLGIERIGASIPTLIALCLPPVLVTGVAVLQGRERVDAVLLVVLAAALGGTALIVVHPGDGAGALPAGAMLAGVGFSIASALLYAAFTLVSGRLSQRLGAGPMTTCLTVVAAVVMGLTGLIRPLAWPVEVSPEAWLLYLGIVTAALALLAFSWGAARLTPTALTVATLVEPLTAVALSALLLGERLSAAQWLGGGLLMASIWGLSARESRQRDGSAA